MSPPEIMALWIAKIFLKIPCVLMIGGTCFYEPINFKNRIFRWNYSKALSLSDKIVVYSKRMIPDVKKINPSINDLKFVTVHNAVDEQRFFPNKKNESFLKNLRIDKNEKIILFVGKINIRKGVLDIIRSIDLLEEKNVKAIFVGSYSKNSQDFKKIEAEIKFRNLTKKAIFVGNVPNDQLLNYYSCADLFVYLTKKCEGIPRAILESMACGKPIISTNVAGIPEAVINDLTGYVVDSVEEASSKIDQLFSDLELYNKLSKNCRKKILHEFVYDVTLPKMLDIFKSVLNETK
jgi:glycosyltransferase involved in cell wall biosynthesis